METVVPAAKRLSPVELFSKLAPSVVKLIVHGEGGLTVGSGSGFVLSAPSPTIRHVVTNHHVIRAAMGINVEFHDGSVASARDVLSEDQSLDLAILRVDLLEPREPIAQSTIDVQNADQPPVGTRLYAIGSPRGMKNTLSEGLLSGYRPRDSQVTWVQITNPISPGSSGGPVFTDTGAFVGITTASLPDAQNLNFAISAKKLQEVVAGKKGARPLWKGSCISCEEHDFLFRFYSEAFERFRKKDGNSEFRAPFDWRDVSLWTLGIVYEGPTQRFLEFCTTEAGAGNLSALILMGSFKVATTGPTSPEGTVESIAERKEAITLLKRALPLAGDDRFFILLKLGQAQDALLFDIQLRGTLQERGSSAESVGGFLRHCSGVPRRGACGSREKPGQSLPGPRGAQRGPLLVM